MTGVLGMALAAVLMPGSATSAAVQDVRAERVERVRFARGASSATVRGRIQGYRMVDYLVNARAGQRMTVRLQTPGRFTYFVVRGPESDENLYDATSTERTANLTLPETGDYRIRVFQMRNAARRGEASNYTLTIRIAP